MFIKEFDPITYDSEKQDWNAVKNMFIKEFDPITYDSEKQDWNAVKNMFIKEFDPITCPALFKKKIMRHHGSVKCVMVFDDSLVILRDVTIK